MKKVLISIFFIGIFLIFGFYVYVFLNSGDDVLNNDEHLVPVVKQIRDDENSWFLLEQAEKNMYYPEEKAELIKQLVDGSYWDQKFAQELVSHNQNVYGLIDRALKKEYFIAPSMNGIDLKNVDFKMNVRRLIERKINRLLLVNAMYQMKIGNVDEGVKNILESLALGYKIRNKNNSMLIDCLSGMAMNKQAYSVIKVILRNEIPSDAKKMLIEKLDLIKNDEKCLDEAYKWEYLLMKSMVFSMVDDEKRHSGYYFKPQQTINLYNEYFTQSMYRDCNESVSFKKMKKISKLQAIITENAVGKVLYSLLPTVNNVNQKRCEELDEINKLQLQIRSVSK